MQGCPLPGLKEACNIVMIERVVGLGWRTKRDLTYSQGLSTVSRLQVFSYGKAFIASKKRIEVTRPPRQYEEV